MQPVNTTFSKGPSKILMFADTWHAKGVTVPQATASAPGQTTLVNGRRILKEGTFYPSNDASAQGVVLQDYDLTDNEQNIAVIIAGDIKSGVLPEAPNANAISALPRITFHDAFVGYPVAFSVSGSNGTIAAAVGEDSISTGDKVYPGKTVTFTATPSAGYEVDEWSGNGVASGTGNVTYTLVVGESSETITVKFKSAT